MFITEERARQIVTEIKAIIHYDLNLMDGEGRIIASTDPARAGQLHMGARRVIEERLDVLAVEEDDEASGMRKGINLPIILDDVLTGVIGITGEPVEVAVYGSVIQKMVELMIAEIRQQELANLCETARFNFVEQWLFDNGARRQSFETQARLLDIDVDVPRILAVFEAADGGEGFSPELRGEQVLRHLRVHTDHDRRNISLAVNRGYLVLFATGDAEEVRQRAGAICRELQLFFGLPVCCGISSVAETCQQVPGCYKEAVTACRTVAASRMGVLAVYNEASPLYILQSIPHEVIDRLEKAVFRNCPEEEKTELLKTLTAFFRHDGNSMAAAEELYIHPNTFLYRLKKVAAVTGLEPRKPRNMALLYLLSMRHLLDAGI